MGHFNALVAVKAERTFIESNLVLELQKLLRPYMPYEFDWYAIGCSEMRFAAFLHPVDGWTDEFDSDFEISCPMGYMLIPIRCHG